MLFLMHEFRLLVVEPIYTKYGAKNRVVTGFVVPLYLSMNYVFNACLNRAVQENW
jgi:hypothetical protein